MPGLLLVLWGIAAVALHSFTDFGLHLAVIVGVAVGLEGGRARTRV